MNLKEKLLYAMIENGDIDICNEYGEQGYLLEPNKQAIIFGDWNRLDNYPNFREWLEDRYELEWIDEWIIDYESSKCYRTVGDSYSWEQQWRLHDSGEIITPDSDIEDWIDYAENSPDRVLPSFLDIDLEELGYKLINDDLQNGWYGRNDSPSEILEELENEGYTSVIFQLGCVSQFAIDFEVYAKK